LGYTWYIMIFLRNRGVEESSEENHDLALDTKKGGEFKRNFKQTFKDEKYSSNPGYNQSNKFNASYVTNMDTMQEIVQPRRSEDNMLLLLTLI
jgi:hypothetical protein